MTPADIASAIERIRTMREILPLADRSPHTAASASRYRAQIRLLQRDIMGEYGLLWGWTWHAEGVAAHHLLGQDRNGPWRVPYHCTAPSSYWVGGRCMALASEPDDVTAGMQAEMRFWAHMHGVLVQFPHWPSPANPPRSTLCLFVSPATMEMAA